VNTIELWHWRVTDPVSRCRYVTRYRMTQANALHFDPAAERVEGSLERRLVRNDLPSMRARVESGAPTQWTPSSLRADRERSQPATES
jgi:hypothetical protein